MLHSLNFLPSATQLFTMSSPSHPRMPSCVKFADDVKPSDWKALAKNFNDLGEYPTLLVILNGSTYNMGAGKHTFDAFLRDAKREDALAAYDDLQEFSHKNLEVASQHGSAPGSLETSRRPSMDDKNTAEANRKASIRKNNRIRLAIRAKNKNDGRKAFTGITGSFGPGSLVCTEKSNGAATTVKPTTKTTFDAESMKNWGASWELEKAALTSDEMDCWV